jgi:hypothetical protein
MQSKYHDIEMSLRGILRGFGLKVGKTALVQFLGLSILCTCHDPKAMRWPGFRIWTNCSRVAILIVRSSFVREVGTCASSSVFETWWR